MLFNSFYPHAPLDELGSWMTCCSEGKTSPQGGLSDQWIKLYCREPAHEIPSKTRSWPDKQGRSGPQGFRKAAPACTLKMTSVFLILAILDDSLISVTWVERLPRSLSKQNQLRTLINMSAGRWSPIRLSRMKGVFQFRPLCWHSSLLGKCILMYITAHNTLIVNSIKNLIT